MKTKIKILIVSCVMAAAAVTGFNMAQNSNNMDITLADIAVMAKAGEETPPHSATYECVDVDDYQAESSWLYIFRERICEAPACGRNYYKAAFPPRAECTVYYNF